MLLVDVFGSWQNHVYCLPFPYQVEVYGTQVINPVHTDMSLSP